MLFHRLLHILLQSRRTNRRRRRLGGCPTGRVYGCVASRHHFLFAAVDAFHPGGCLDVVGELVATAEVRLVHGLHLVGVVDVVAFVRPGVHVPGSYRALPFFQMLRPISFATVIALPLRQGLGLGRGDGRVRAGRRGKRGPEDADDAARSRPASARPAPWRNPSPSPRYDPEARGRGGREGTGGAESVARRVAREGTGRRRAGRREGGHFRAFFRGVFR